MAPGRKSRLTPSTQKSICDAIRLGATYQLAAEYAGVGYSTFNLWMRQGREAQNKRDNAEEQGLDPELSKEEKKKLAFLEAVTQANSAGLVTNLALIRKKATDDWRAAAWIVERRFAKDYAPKTRQEISGVDGGPIETKINIDEIRKKRWESITDQLGEMNLDE